MKIRIILLLSAVLITLVSFAQADEINRTTHIYSVKGTDTLRLDRYYLPSAVNPQPCLIYVFGGGFAGGVKSSDSYNKLFSNMLNQGYSVVSIDYRLGMKGVKDPSEFPAALIQSIFMAVEDLFDATRYVIDNAEDLNINPDMIVTCGSSAGAITVLQAEYAISNNEVLSEKLPDGFDYAGVIAFAGAIFNMDAKLQWANKPAPILLFHGDADKSVPFDKIEMMNAGLYGSKHIADQLNTLQYPHYFYKVENAAHEMAVIPMDWNLNEINAFLQQFVKEKRQLITNTAVQQIGKPEMKKDFSLMDYIRANTQ